MELRKFEELETKVLALLERSTALAAKNEELAAALEKVELDLMAAQERVEHLEKERHQVLEKVDGLLNRLE